MSPHEDSYQACRRAVSNGLPSAVRHLGLSLEEAQLDRFALYAALLLEANKHLNLTAITEPGDVVRKHFVDSLAVVKALPRGLPGESIAVIDVGTGGGLPGLALALALPSWRVTLVESVAKKVRFLEEIVAALNLTTVEICCDRAETLGRSILRDSADLAVARAVAPAPVLVEYCAPLVRAGGLIALYKSRNVAREMELAGKAVVELRCRLESTVSVSEITAGEQRVIVLLQKEDSTPQRYPRRVGQPARHPL